MRAAAFLLCVLSGGAPAAVLLDRIAVTVGKEVITEGDLYDEIRVTAFLNGQPLDFSPPARRRAAERLVDQELIRREMNLARYPQPETSEAQKILAELKKKRFRGEAEYTQALKQYGITGRLLLEHILWQIAALRFTDYRFQPGIPPPNEATRQHLEKNVEERASAEAKTPPRPIPQTDGDSESGVPDSVDQEMDAWLKQARTTTRIDFRLEVFQ
jgi:hypothetical protein